MNSALLFQPYRIGPVNLQSRIVMAPMTRGRAPGGIAGSDVAAYYARRAAARVGLVISEGIWVDTDDAANLPNVPRLGGEAQLEALARVTAAVHEERGAIFAQLWHTGFHRAGTELETPMAPAISPSGMDASGMAQGRAMTSADIDRIIEAYARSAANARATNFDGIEIHGAHGYLPDQFFSLDTNRRCDRYGNASYADRTRFAVELVAAIRSCVGPDFPICFRISQWKLWNYDGHNARDAAELEAWTTPLADAGVDLFHCSTRRYWEPEFDKSGLNLAGWVKKLTGKPTITVGSVGLQNDLQASLVEGGSIETRLLDDLLERLDRGEFDLVAVGRILLNNPDWAQLVEQGRFQDIKPFKGVSKDSDLY